MSSSLKSNKRAGMAAVPAPAAIAWADRRSEARNAATGEVVLALDGPLPTMVSGELLDVSASGFRAKHGSPLVETGSSVRFRHATAAGIARVCWNRSCDGRWETGFLILQK